MEVDPEVAFRAIRKNGSKMLNDSSIETIKLIRALDSEEIISPELYEDMTDKTKNWGNTDSLEHLLKHLRTAIQKDGQLFIPFVKVLFECDYSNVASALLATYNCKFFRLSVIMCIYFYVKSMSCKCISDTFHLSVIM